MLVHIGWNFSSKIISVAPSLFGTLEYMFQTDIEETKYLGGGGNDINFLEIVSAFPWIFFLAAMSDILYAGKVAP